MSKAEREAYYMMTTTTYPTLEQAVEAARQEQFPHHHCLKCGLLPDGSRRVWHDYAWWTEDEYGCDCWGDYKDPKPCTDSHDPDPHATALRAIAAAYVAVSELPAFEGKAFAMADLDGSYKRVAEATP